MKIKISAIIVTCTVLTSGCAVDSHIRQSGVLIEEAGQKDKAPDSLVKSLDDRYVAMVNRNEQYLVPGTPVAKLLSTAKQQQQQGQLHAAASSLERALRIAPRNALLWHQLASLRYQQGDLPQALQMANKSNSFAGNDKQMLVNNWQIIAHIRQQQGDQQGLKSAQAKLAELRK